MSWWRKDKSKPLPSRFAYKELVVEEARGGQWVVEARIALDGNEVFLTCPYPISNKRIVLR